MGLEEAKPGNVHSRCAGGGRMSSEQLHSATEGIAATFYIYVMAMYGALVDEFKAKHSQLSELAHDLSC